MINPHYSIQSQCRICKRPRKRSSRVNDLFIKELNENKLNHKRIIKNYEYNTDQEKTITFSTFIMKTKDFVKFNLQLVRCRKRGKTLFMKDTVYNSNNNNIEELDEGNNNMSDIHSNSTTEDKTKTSRDNDKVILNLAEEKAIVLNQMKIKEEKRKQLRALEEENRKKEEENRLEEKRKIAEFNEKDNEHQMRKLNKCDDYVNLQKDADQVKTVKPYMKRVPAVKTQKDKKPKEITSYPVEPKAREKPKEELKEPETDHAIIYDYQSDQGPNEGHNIDDNLKNRASLGQQGENEEVATPKDESRKGDTDKMSGEEQKPSKPVVNKVPVSQTPKYQQQRGVTKTTQPRPGQPRPGQPRPGQPKPGQPRQTQPRQTQPRQTQPSRAGRAPMKGGNAKKVNNAKAINKKEPPNGELNGKEPEVNIVEPIEEEHVKPASCTEKDPIVKKSNAGCCQTNVKTSKPPIEAEEKKASISNNQHDMKETEGEIVPHNGKIDSHSNN